jgi:hypothetical protein
MMYWLADTYTEIENGLPVDYNCGDDKKSLLPQQYLTLRNYPTCMSTITGCKEGGLTQIAAEARVFPLSNAKCSTDQWCNHLVCQP